MKLNSELDDIVEISKKNEQRIVSEELYDRAQEILMILDHDTKLKKLLEKRMKRDDVKKYRKNILNANDNECFVCKCSVVSVLHIHHLIPIADGGNNNFCNLVVLCPTCHAIIHKLISRKLGDHRSFNKLCGEFEDTFTKRQVKRLLNIGIFQQKERTEWY